MQLQLPGNLNAVSGNLSSSKELDWAARGRRARLKEMCEHHQTLESGKNTPQAAHTCQFRGKINLAARLKKGHLSLEQSHVSP